MEVSAINREELRSLLDAFPKDRQYALPAMQDMQRHYNYVPREGLEELARHIHCPLSTLYAMATFYKAISLEPKGKHIIKVCDGTACHIRGSVSLIGAIGRELGIGPDETTEDGEFSLELVSCVGACALAPVMVIDETYYGNVTQEKLTDIFEAVRGGASP